MVENLSPRFKSAPAALRFYFRAQEVLSAKASSRLHLEGRIPATGHSARQDLMLDYLSVAACMKELNELQLWLLRELYRPHKFGEPAGSVSRACDSGRQLFPRVRWTLQGVGRLHRHTIRILERRLAGKELIPALPLPPHPRSQPQTAIRTSDPSQGATHEFYRFQNQTSRTSLRMERGAANDASRGAPGKAPRRRREVVFDHSRAGRRAMSDR